MFATGMCSLKWSLTDTVSLGTLHIYLRSGDLVVMLCNPFVRTMELGSVIVNPSLVKSIRKMGISSSMFLFGHVGLAYCNIP